MILPNGARGPNILTTYWGVEVATFDIGFEMAKFSLDPTCGLAMNFRVIVLNPSNQPVSPREVDCSDLTTCYVEKCNGGPSTSNDGDCIGLPFNIYYKVIIQAYLSDGITINEAITFPVEILDPCAGDKLTFSPGISSFAYMLYTPSEPAFRAPTILSTTYGLCPMTCTVRDNALGQDTVPSVMTNNVNTGEIAFQTGSKSFRGATLYYKLTCTSTLSQVTQGTIENTFEVQIIDECDNIEIAPAGFNDFTTLVFVPNSNPVYAATSNKICGGFEYSIATPMSASWPQIELQNGSILINPTSIDNHVSIWDVQIRACLVLTGECKLGPVGSITVINPCLSTNIIGGEINSIMSAPELGSDNLNLSLEMTTVTGDILWPFFDSVDANFAGFQECGSINYVLLDTSFTEVVGPVTRQGNMLYFSPPLGYPLGYTNFILRGYLARYSNIFLDVPFQVEVLACSTTIDPTNVYVENKIITWGNPALPYSIGNIFS